MHGRVCTGDLPVYRHIVVCARTGTARKACVSVDTRMPKRMPSRLAVPDRGGGHVGY